MYRLFYVLRHWPTRMPPCLNRAREQRSAKVLGRLGKALDTQGHGRRSLPMLAATPVSVEALEPVFKRLWAWEWGFHYGAG